MDMKKNWLKYAGMIIIAAVLTILVGINSFRIVAPTGVLIAPLAGLIPVAVTIAIGTVSGIITAVGACFILLLLGDADWLMLANFVLITAMVGWIIGWRLPLRQKVSHQQLIWLALGAAIAEAVLNLIFVGLVGWQTGGNWLAFIRLDLVATILTALMYAVLTAPLAMVFRWLARQILPDDNHPDKPQGPVEINLSEHSKKNKEKGGK